VQVAGSSTDGLGNDTVKVEKLNASGKQHIAQGQRLIMPMIAGVYQAY
jgi:hypothetical protein